MPRNALLSSLVLVAALGTGALANQQNTSSAAPRHTVTHLTTLGDSYTDKCNTWRYRNATDEQKLQYPFPYCPPAPVGRASGAESWPEYIGLYQGLPVVTNKDELVRPAPQRGTWNVTNLAQSAATCDNDVFDRSPVLDVGQQIELLKNNYNTTEARTRIETDPQTSWAALFIGTNDLSYYTNVSAADPETECIERRLRSLHTYGFRNLLLFENINLQNTPLYAGADGTNATMKAFVNANRRAQAQLVDRLNQEWDQDGARITIFPTYDLFKRMYTRPAEYGFNDSKNACVDADGNVCARPTVHLWYDALHPSFVAQSILARKVVRFLEDGARGEDLLSGPI